MRKLKSITETNLKISEQNINSSITLLYYLKDTHFLYHNDISFLFSLKYFGEKSFLPIALHPLRVKYMIILI